MGVAGCRRGQWPQRLSGNFVSLGNQRKVLGVEPAVLGPGRGVIKHVFTLLVVRARGHWLQEGGQCGLSLQHRNLSEPVIQTGSGLL